MIAGRPRTGIYRKSLAEEFPGIARQWDAQRNGKNTPETATAGSNFRAAWRCDIGCRHCGEPHHWHASVASRCLHESGCPFCSGNRVCRCQSMAAEYPLLMKEWDWDGNKGIDPYTLGCYSYKKVSWMCPEHGAWITRVATRCNLGSGCPECGEERKTGYSVRRGFLKAERPDIYAQLHSNKNIGVDVEQLTCGSHKKVWFLCTANKNRPKGCHHEHAWQARIYHRCKSRNPTGCPFCSGQLVCPCNAITAVAPAAMLFWDCSRNLGVNPARVGPESHRKVWWRHLCSDGHLHSRQVEVGPVVRILRESGRLMCKRCASTARLQLYSERRERVLKAS